jgi:hypothetical protein
MKCAHCGAEFTRAPRAGRQRFCSRTCRLAARYQRVKPLYTISITQLACPACGTWFRKTSTQKVCPACSQSREAQIHRLEAKLNTAIPFPAGVQARARELIEQTNCNGRTYEDAVAAAYALACREAGCPVPLSRVAGTLDTTAPSVWNVYTELAQAAPGLAPRSPAKLIPHLCRKLRRPDLVAPATALVTKAMKCLKLMGKNPYGIAAAGVYFVARKTLTQDEVAAAASVTSVTLRKRIESIITNLLLHRPRHGHAEANYNKGQAVRAALRDHVAAHPGVTVKTLRKTFPLAQCTLNRHLQMLVAAKDLRRVKQGRAYHYYKKEEKK